MRSAAILTRGRLSVAVTLGLLLALPGLAGCRRVEWAKWVTGIEVSDNTSFTGFWESQWADNTATISGTN